MTFQQVKPQATATVERAKGSAPAAPVLQIEGVSKQFAPATGPITALDGVNLSVCAGEFVALLGASGCGKTTLLRIIAGLETASKGRVMVEGKVVSAPADGVGFVFQAPVLLPYRTVLSNVLLPAELHGGVTDTWIAQARRLLRATGLEAFEDARPSELSGGMRQRASICRALLEDPRILLMDEPFGALDAMTRDAMNEDLHRLWRATGMTVVFVTHDIAEAVRLATRIVVLSSRPGRILRCIDSTIPGATEYEDKIRSVKYLELINEIRSLFSRDHGGRSNP